MSTTLSVMKSPASLDADQPDSSRHSHTAVPQDATTTVSKSTHRRSNWTPYTLQAYTNESQVQGGINGCPIPSAAQGKNVFSKDCPMSLSSQLERYKDDISKLWKEPVCAEAYATVTGHYPDAGEEHDLMTALYESPYDIMKSLFAPSVHNPAPDASPLSQAAPYNRESQEGSVGATTIPAEVH